MKHRIEAFLTWLGGRLNWVLVVILLVVGGSWAFIAIADEVLEGETQHFDEWAIRVLRDPDNPSDPVGPKWLEEMGRDCTALGGFAVMGLVTIGVCGFLWFAHRRDAVWLVLISTAGAFILSTILKNTFARERPSVVPHLSIVMSSSFPSGHSMMSSAVYLTLGTLVASFVESRVLKIYVLVVALVLTFLVGVSRVYMGVHYPTDVLAGWTAGLVWALLVWLGARWLQHRPGHEVKETM